MEQIKAIPRDSTIGIARYCLYSRLLKKADEPFNHARYYVCTFPVR